MVNSISEAQLEEVINRLSQHLSGKEELRDIASIGTQSLIFPSSCFEVEKSSHVFRFPQGLKSVIVEIPATSNVVGNLCKRLTPKLLSSIKTVRFSSPLSYLALFWCSSEFGWSPFSQESTSYEVKMDGLDLLAELLSRFGPLMVPFHQVRYARSESDTQARK